ncbi:MAG TPA: aldolase/citrate lyase family protein [Candidatus Nanopelagicales bacterium]|nr:aldolase/citrate lyase family protein [Candidatus Nanopelagicales bacterium]
MRANPWLDAIRAGNPALGGWISNPSTINAEIMGAAGFEYVAIDTQHGAIDYSSMLPLLQVLAIGNSTPIVRVPSNDSGHIGKALDAGARAVIVPMVNDRESCERAMSAIRYAPDGERSFGPTRAVLVEGDDYFDFAADQISLIPMIETVEAMGNIDNILSVPGVEAIYVGPNDLSISLGLKPNTNDPRLDEAMVEIVAGCRRHGVVPGVHASAALCAKRLEQGFGMVTVSADVVALRSHVRQDLATARGTAAETITSTY